MIFLDPKGKSINRSDMTLVLYLIESRSIFSSEIHVQLLVNNSELDSSFSTDACKHESSDSCPAALFQWENLTIRHRRLSDKITKSREMNVLLEFEETARRRRKASASLSLSNDSSANEIC